MLHCQLLSHDMDQSGVLDFSPSLTVPLPLFLLQGGALGSPARHAQVERTLKLPLLPVRESKVQ